MPIVKPTGENLKKAKEILQDGGIIAYPTETFYALGANPFNMNALERLFMIKMRSPDKPVSILVKNKEALNNIVEDISDIAKELINRFWPGPLTIVFKARENVPDVLTASTGRIGVRVSSSQIAKKLLDMADIPLTATSANPSGKESPVTAEDVERYFGSSLDMIIDGGVLTGRLGSTIVDVTEGDVKILREGEIPVEKVILKL